MALPAFLQTTKKGNFTSWKFRTIMNWYPMYFGTGGKILFISDDFRELHLRIRLNLWTYNYVGTIFGGSMFSATDPFYMLMLLRNFGKSYVVWDKSASIKFVRPAKKTLYAKYLVSDELLESIRQEVMEKGECTRIMTIELKDENEIVYAVIERNVYVADKKHYEQKKGMSQSAKLGK
jgi:acyl-coenzyme A thioesterase PaaI-like protein